MIGRNIKEKFEGFSLVEMLLTIAIIGVVMVIASTTLSTLIKVSSVSSNKTRVRTETEFVLELVRRTVRNSDPSDVYIYNTSAYRTYNPETNTITNNELVDMPQLYATPVGENEPGTEIHFRPYGYTSWVCIGFFPSTSDPDMGYILKTSAQNLFDQHENCFENTQDFTKYTIILNSDYVDINNFEIAYTTSADGNYLIRFDLEAEPTQWYLGPDAPVVRTVYRQAVVSTQGITW